MSNRNENKDVRRADGANPLHKGESQPAQHQGGPSVSKKNKEPHRKDESEGSDRNTTKKQSNSI
ncbi:hypothetical protein [Flaviaesturariibacter amylovorans]|uniref:Uncharacterized protein n=1 Tax=Flaviaesturariibacter amylovorans TaxID=1084520 RepID=A0ABP8HM35_9BACT